MRVQRDSFTNKRIVHTILKIQFLKENILKRLRIFDRWMEVNLKSEIVFIIGKDISQIQILALIHKKIKFILDLSSTKWLLGRLSISLASNR